MVDQEATIIYNLYAACDKGALWKCNRKWKAKNKGEREYLLKP